MAEIEAWIENADCHDGEREYGRTWLQMTAERLVGIGERQVCVDFTVDDIAVHADEIGRSGWVFDERVL